MNFSEGWEHPGATKPLELQYKTDNLQSTFFFLDMYILYPKRKIKSTRGENLFLHTWYSKTFEHPISHVSSISKKEYTQCLYLTENTEATTKGATNYTGPTVTLS